MITKDEELELSTKGVFIIICIIILIVEGAVMHEIKTYKPVNNPYELTWLDYEVKEAIFIEQFRQELIKEEIKYTTYKLNEYRELIIEEAELRGIHHTNLGSLTYYEVRAIGPNMTQKHCWQKVGAYKECMVIEPEVGGSLTYEVIIGRDYMCAKVTNTQLRRQVFKLIDRC